MIAEDLALLTQSLPPWGQAGTAAAEPLAAYLDYYGLTPLLGAGRQHAAGVLCVGGERIAVQSFTPANPLGKAVVCHGYYDHVGLYRHLIDYLLRRRLAVLAFDLPGHGLSSGQRATIASFDAYVLVLEAVLAEAPASAHLLGQSLGGAILMEYLARHPDAEPGQVILLAPLVRPAGWRLNRIIWRVCRRWRRQIPRAFAHNSEDQAFLAFLRQDPLQPRSLPIQWVDAMVAWMRHFEQRPAMPGFRPLVVQGLADGTVDWRHNLAVIERLFSARVLRLADARHHLVNESTEQRQLIWRWLDEQCGWDESERA